MAHHSDPTDAAAAAPVPVGFLALDAVQLPVYDLAEFQAADLARVSSYVTNFGSWQLPAEVSAVLGSGTAAGALLEWIHDTGELVLLGGVPTIGNASFEATAGVAATAGNLPAFLGGTMQGAQSEANGMVREFFKTELVPEGTRVALLAHIAHGPAVHELLWGWHGEHRKPTGWDWLVERLAGLETVAGGDAHLA